MRPRIYLDHTAKDRAVLIMKFTYKKGTRLNYSLGIETKPRWWNKTKQRLTSSHPYAANYNTTIEIVINKTIEVYNRYMFSGELDKLTTNKFREELKKAQGLIEDNRITFLVFYIEHIKNYNESTRRTYNTTYNRLISFQKWYKKFDFEDIDFDWLQSFEFYSFNILELKPNTAAKSIKQVKVILRESYERGLHRNTIFDNRKFKIEETQTEGVYLNLDELSKIYHHQFDSEALGKIRDIFILACFTGQRISDWSKLKKANIRYRDNKAFFIIHTQKTNTEVSIPLHPVVEIICKKYSYDIPSVKDQVFNRKIKEVCKLVGIKQKIIRTEYEKGKPYKQSYLKYQLISSHTARRSFATNMYQSGVELEKIKHVTGHKKIETLELYIKSSALDKGAVIAKADFFKGTGFLKAI